MDWSIIVDPLKTLLTSIMSYLPRIIAVVVLLIIAWILAAVLKSVVRKIVMTSGIDKRMSKGEDTTGKSKYPIANGAGTAVFWIVWIFFLLAILQVLGLEGVLSSIAVLFEKIFAAIPNILAALIVLIIFYLLGRFLSGMVTTLLTKIRFNELPVKLGLAKQPVEGANSPASLVGYIVLIFIMLFAITMAAELCGFTVLNDLVSNFTEFLALVILGVIVIGIGIFIANLVAKIMSSGGRPQTVISLVRLLIIILSVAVGLRAMGFANDMILLIFGLLLGAVAIATAIAFGMGGRKVAGELLDRWAKSDTQHSDKKAK